MHYKDRGHGGSLLGDDGGVFSFAFHCAITSGGKVAPRCQISNSLFILSYNERKSNAPTTSIVRIAVAAVALTSVKKAVGSDRRVRFMKFGALGGEGRERSEAMAMR